MIKVLTINSITFPAPDKFKPGDRLSSSEARVLSHLWRESAQRVLNKYLEFFPLASKEELESELKFVTLTSYMILPTNIEIKIEEQKQKILNPNVETSPMLGEKHIVAKQKVVARILKGFGNI